MGLGRFTAVQEKDDVTALCEIWNGKKRSHWMWYIFPQLKGLGFCETAQFCWLDGEAEKPGRF